MFKIEHISPFMFRADQSMAKTRCCRNVAVWPISEVLLFPIEPSVLGNSGPTLARLSLLGTTEERREHFLESGDQVVGLAVPRWSCP